MTTKSSIRLKDHDGYVIDIFLGEEGDPWREERYDDKQALIDTTTSPWSELVEISFEVKKLRSFLT
jgi:hypothetical protein